MHPIRSILSALLAVIVCASLSVPAVAKAKLVVVFTLRSTPELAARAATVTKAVAARIEALDGYESLVVALPKDSPGAAAARAGAEIYVRGQLVASSEGYRVTISSFSVATDKALGEQTIVLGGTALPNTFDVAALVAPQSQQTSLVPNSVASQASASGAVFSVSIAASDSVTSLAPDEHAAGPSFLQGLLENIAGSVASAAGGYAANKVSQMIPGIPTSLASSLGDALSQSLQSSLAASTGTPPLPTGYHALTPTSNTKQNQKFTFGPTAIRFDRRDAMQMSTLYEANNDQLTSFVTATNFGGGYTQHPVPHQTVADFLSKATRMPCVSEVQTADQPRTILGHNSYHVLGKYDPNGKSNCAYNVSYDAWVAFIDATTGGDAVPFNSNALEIYMIKTGAAVALDNSSVTNSFHAVTSITSEDPALLSPSSLTLGKKYDSYPLLVQDAIQAQARH